VTFNRRFKFEKRCRLLVSTDDESLSVVAVHSNIAFDFVDSHEHAGDFKEP
jgi:hypothetical protein